MSDGAPELDSLERIFESAPCGYVATDPDGLILAVNETFEAMIDRPRGELVGRRRFVELLTGGGRIYHGTHLLPLLHLHGAAHEIALDLVRADGTRVPVFVNVVLHRGPGDEPREIRAIVFGAAERRSFEKELIAARHHEQDIARRLQESLLAGRLPTHPNLELAVSYRPATRGLEVGGDWYDAFTLGPDVIGLVIGDVVGRGVDAAATMGQLRSAVRALALADPDPGVLLQALDRYAALHGVGRMTTVVYARLDLARGSLRFSCAGHPPPAIIVPGEPPSLAWDGRSTPIDAAGTTDQPRPTAELLLPAGACVLLYTDGLVERRTENLDDGLDRLLAAAAARQELEVTALVEELVGAVQESGHTDDVCLLAARVH